MENSQAYIEFKNQIKATGNQKMAGYNSKTLDEIFEWEREEVENLICIIFAIMILTWQYFFLS